MKRIIKCVVINLIIMILLFAVIEVLIFGINKCTNKFFEDSKFRYMVFKPFISYENISDFFDTDNFNPTNGRLPVGLEYKSTPIIVFGCSYAYGQGLESEQTFGYKLSNLLKRPVYNRAVYGQGFQEMYYQSENPFFYNQVGDFDTVVYIMIDDHYARAYTTTCEYMDTWFLLHYDIKNGELVYQNYSNPLMNFLKSLYLVKLINYKYFYAYTPNPKNAEKVTDDALLYFVKTRENLEENLGHKVKFYILMYDKISHLDLLTEKLEENGFVVLSTKQLTNEDLDDDKYIIVGDGHPSEAAWDLLTPFVAERIIKDESK